ncbi:MAG: sulfur carrier protein ThiS [Planctomycetota bacterium]|jgi:sulfur carrier protein
MSPTEEIFITVNGNSRKVCSGVTIAELIKTLEVRSTAFAVERNKKVVRKVDHSTTLLSDGDVINIVTFVGGG